jgi:hypothetical protein
LVSCRVNGEFCEEKEKAQSVGKLGIVWKTQNAMTEQGIRTGTGPKLAGGVISLVLFPAFESSSRVLEVIIVEESTILASPKSQI